jgi:hypothetical protein
VGLQVARLGRSRSRANSRCVGGVTVVDGGGGIGDSWHQGGELTREEEKDVIWFAKFTS